MIRSNVLALATALAAAGLAQAGPAPESPTEVRPLLVGAEIPAVALERPDGQRFDLGAAVRKQPTVLIFYRGGW